MNRSEFDEMSAKFQQESPEEFAAILDKVRSEPPMSLEDFTETYIRPRAQALAGKMKRNEPLTPEELEFVEIMFGLEHDPDRVFICLPPK